MATAAEKKAEQEKAATQNQGQAAPATVGQGDHNPFAHGLLEQAADLAKEKEALFKRIGANRDMLRQIKTTGLLSAEQAAAIDEWYPARAKKDDTTTTEPAAN